jgi:uncharacterized damage-inducible protein DinB
MAVDWDTIMGSERETLLHYLGKQRNRLLRICGGLTEEQLRAQVLPSETNLLGVIRHLTAVEEHWFQRVFLGDHRERDDSMIVPEGVASGEIIDAYRRAWARSDEIVRATPDMSTMSAIPNPGEDQLDSLRVIMAHMIEETAQHVGHADIVRELIDGATDL